MDLEGWTSVNSESENVKTNNYGGFSVANAIEHLEEEFGEMNIEDIYLANSWVKEEQKILFMFSREIIYILKVNQNDTVREFNFYNKGSFNPTLKFNNDFYILELKNDFEKLVIDPHDEKQKVQNDKGSSQEPRNDILNQWYQDMNKKLIKLYKEHFFEK